MIRAIGLVLALITGSATAGELADCFNDDIDAETRYTSNEPEVLRVTDADLTAMLERIREHEDRAVAGIEPESTFLVRNDSGQSTSD